MPIVRVTAVLAALAGTSLACAASAFEPARADGGAGSATAIAHWQIQSSAKAQQGGAEVSSAGYSTRDWYPVSGRATVMAGLLENGSYPNVFYSDNLRAVEEPDLLTIIGQDLHVRDALLQRFLRTMKIENTPADAVI